MNSFRIGGLVGVLLALACFWYWQKESSRADSLEAKANTAEEKKHDAKPEKSHEDSEKDAQEVKDARSQARNALIFGVVLAVLGAGLILAPRFQRKPAPSSP